MREILGVRGLRMAKLNALMGGVLNAQPRQLKVIHGAHGMMTRASRIMREILGVHGLGIRSRESCRGERGLQGLRAVNWNCVRYRQGGEDGWWKTVRIMPSS